MTIVIPSSSQSLRNFGTLARTNIRSRARSSVCRSRNCFQRSSMACRRPPRSRPPYPRGSFLSMAWMEKPTLFSSETVSTARNVDEEGRGGVKEGLFFYPGMLKMLHHGMYRGACRRAPAGPSSRRREACCLPDSPACDRSASASGRWCSAPWRVIIDLQMFAVMAQGGEVRLLVVACVDGVGLADGPGQQALAMKDAV